MSLKKSALNVLLVMAALGSGCRRDDSKKIVRQEPPGQITASPKSPQGQPAGTSTR